MIDKRTLAQAVHSWGAQTVPFSDQPKTELFRTASLDRATALLNQSAALRSLMLLSGEKDVGKFAPGGRWLCSLEPKAYFSLGITQCFINRHRSAGVLFAKTRQSPQTPMQQQP